MSDSTRPPARHPTGSFTTETDTERALRVALEARDLAREQTATLADHDDRIGALEQLVGELPSALPGARGRGLAQHLVDLTAKVDALTKAIDADREARAAEAKALSERRAPLSRAGWIALGAAISFLVVALLGAVSAALARHWI
jgi:hypothetical protein